MAKKATKSTTLSKTIIKAKNTDEDLTTATPYTRKYDNLISFQFKIFNPLKWAMQYLQRLQEDRDGKITLQIPFMWYLTFLVFLVGGSGALGAVLGGPYAFFQGQLAERNIWVSMPTPTPIVIIPTPAPVLVTRLGTIKATYQVKNLLPTPTPATSTVSAIFDSHISPTNTPLRYVLIAENGDLIFLKVPSSISLSYYLGQRSLVTGLFEESTRSMNLKDTDDIEVIY